LPRGCITRLPLEDLLDVKQVSRDASQQQAEAGRILAAGLEGCSEILRGTS